MLACARTAFTALEGWTARRQRTLPPRDATVANPRSGDLLDECALT